MKQKIFCMLLFMTAGTASQAEVTHDGFNVIDSRDSHIPWFIIENGNLKKASSFLHHQICKDGLIQAPQMISDEDAFLAGHFVINGGDHHYLFTRSANSDDDAHFHLRSDSSPNTIPAEPAFSSPAATRFTIPMVSASFTGGMLTSTCLARGRDETDRVSS